MLYALIEKFRKKFGTTEHPGLNPRYNGKGQRFYERSRWVPHQGKRECARRVRQAEARTNG